MAVEKKAPEETRGDHIHRTIKGALSMIPIAGGPIVEAFSALISSPVEKRRDAWIEAIVTELHRQVNLIDSLDIKNLKDNPVFVTTLLQASQIAIRNHQSEKLEALKNIVIGVAINPDIDSDIVYTYMQLIDRLTVTHLNVLKFFNDPPRFIQEKGLQMRSFSSIRDIITYTMNEFNSKLDFLEKILKDLDSENLTRGVSDSLNTMMTSSGTIAQRSSNLGKDFLDYIKNN